MAKYVFDQKKHPPASGSRQDYIHPGRYRFRIVSYSDEPSKSSGAEMHTFGFRVVSKGDENNKKLTDYFVMPKSKKDGDFSIRRLNSLIIAVANPKSDKPQTLELSRMKGKEFEAEVGDVREEERKDGDRTYAARTISKIAEFIRPGLDDEENEEADDEDEEDEDSDDDEDDDEEEEEEEEAPKKSKKAPAKKPVAKAKPKAKAKAPARGKKKPADDDDDEDEDDDDDDFDFDDEDDDD